MILIEASRRLFAEFINNIIQLRCASLRRAEVSQIMLKAALAVIAVYE